MSEPCDHGKSPSACFQCMDEKLEISEAGRIDAARRSLKRGLEIRDVRIILKEFKKQESDTTISIALRAVNEISSLRAQLKELQDVH